ncbi:MAG: multicopper oxidase domain-containing protein [Thiohalomonadales bacterium]
MCVNNSKTNYLYFRLAGRTPLIKIAVVILTGAVVLFSSAVNAQVREYFIMAEDQMWDFAPGGKDLMKCDLDGMIGCEDVAEPWTNSHRFNKVRYIQYTDKHYNVKVNQPDWLGVLGPIIRAEVGDELVIHFCNAATSGNYSMHPHGVRYDKDSEGAHYSGVNAADGAPPGNGSQVSPGACFDYHWFADKTSGPGKGEVSSKAWWYHSHIDEPAETNAGLLGALIITAEGKAKADGSPKKIDKEFIAAFFIFNELEGAEPGLIHSINGYFFGNTTGFIMNKGDKVRWHLLGMGNEVDIHTPHWHGNTVSIGAHDVARNTDVVELLPATMITADMTASNPGDWMFHCHVSDHIAGGMMTSYQVQP